MSYWYQRRSDYVTLKSAQVRLYHTEISAAHTISHWNQCRSDYFTLEFVQVRLFHIGISAGQTISHRNWCRLEYFTLISVQLRLFHTEISAGKTISHWFYHRSGYFTHFKVKSVQQADYFTLMLVHVRPFLNTPPPPPPPVEKIKKHFYQGSVDYQESCWMHGRKTQHAQLMSQTSRVVVFRWSARLTWSAGGYRHYI